MSFRLGVDVECTFTDLLLINDDRWLTCPWGVNGGDPGERSRKELIGQWRTQNAAVQVRSCESRKWRSGDLRHLGRRLGQPAGT